jgi:hypothetical protein
MNDSVIFSKNKELVTTKEKIESLKAIKFREKIYFLPSEKVNENSNFFNFNDKFDVEVKDSNNEFIEKFLDCFMVDLLKNENLDNINEIIDVCYSCKLDKKFVKMLSKELLAYVHDQSQLTQINISKNYNLMEIEETKESFFSFPSNSKNSQFHFFKYFNSLLADQTSHTIL